MAIESCTFGEHSATITRLTADIYHNWRCPWTRKFSDKKNIFFEIYVWTPTLVNKALRCDFRAVTRNLRAHLSNRTNRFKKSFLVGEWLFLENWSISAQKVELFPQNGNSSDFFWIEYLKSFQNTFGLGSSGKKFSYIIYFDILKNLWSPEFLFGDGRGTNWVGFGLFSPNFQKVPFFHFLAKKSAGHSVKSVVWPN